MTRISDPLRPGLLLLLTWLGTAPAMAQEIVTDAFGILPHRALDPNRAGWAGMQTVDGARHQVRPEAADVVLLYVSPKTLVAGDEFGQAVALAYDARGNLVADGETALFTLGPEIPTSTTRYGNANVTFFAGTRSGSFLAGAQIGSRQSGRASFDVVADLESVSVSLSDPILAAPQEAIVELGTRHLADAYGNTIADGIGVQLALSHGDNRYSVMTGVSRDGTARADLLTRDIPLDGQLRAFMADKITPPQPLSVTPQTYGFPAEVQLAALPGLGGMTLRIGPLTTDQGYLLNDGSQIDIVLEDARSDRHSVIGWTRDGFFETTLALSPDAGPFRIDYVTTLGRQFETLAVPPAASDRDRQP